MRPSIGIPRPPFAAFCLALTLLVSSFGSGLADDAPAPLIKKGAPPVGWWFAFKFNAATFPACPGRAAPACPFGGQVQNYGKTAAGLPKFGQQFIAANKDRPSLAKGATCIGDTTEDPVGATFDQVYNGSFNYVVWNDQFHSDPHLACEEHDTFCNEPWAHSKGLLAWDDNGNGFVMQVSTPNWPGAGNRLKPRQTNGNTLGCLIKADSKPQNNVMVSQHFFSLKLTKDDVVAMLKAMQTASVVTAKNAAHDSQSQLIKNGGPADIQALVHDLGKVSQDTAVLKQTLSSGVQVIAKPPSLHVPPWHMVSALLDQPLVVATWWTGTDKIQDSRAATPGCWGPGLGRPGTVRNAEAGKWSNKTFQLTGGASVTRNHAKLGVSKTGKFAIFGDFNNEGALNPPCEKSQNTRGGMFYVVEDLKLANELRDLMDSRAPSPNSRNRRRHR